MNHRDHIDCGGPAYIGVVRVLHRKPRCKPVQVTDFLRSEVMRLSRFGLPNTQISARTGLSQTTVRRIKLGVQ